MKKTWKCDECGTRNNIKYEYCKECGTPDMDEENEEYRNYLSSIGE